jgi:hypothetical protein
MTELPDPPVPPDADLKDFPFTPIYRARLFGSSFHARATDAEWRAGVTLWLKSQDQVPAGSLPDDDIDLCRLAELGRDIKTWRKLKAGAMHGWNKHSDGRLYHQVIAEVVNEQLFGKLKRRWSTDCARARKQAQRRSVKLDMPDFDEWMSMGQTIHVPWDNESMSQGQQSLCPADKEPVSQECPMENGSNREREGQGQGQGQGQGSLVEVESSETLTPAPEPVVGDQHASADELDEVPLNGPAKLPKARWPADRAVPMEWVAQTAEQYPRADGYEEAENFRRYWSEGKGKNTARDDVGWRRSWQTWIERSRPGPTDWRDRYGYDRLLHGKHGAPH